MPFMSDPAKTPSVPAVKTEEKPKIDVKLLDQQLADMDDDEFSSDDDSHGGGCGCCAGLVGQIRS